MINKKSNNLIQGALAGSLGIFIAKALGVLYVVPLNYLATDANMSFYSISYTYYNFLLTICTAGIPFAVSRMVAKYYAKKDYKTVLAIRKLSTSFILLTGFVVGLLFILISGPLASFTLSSGDNQEDIKVVQDLFKILAIAIMTVPFLSSIRGYYQGLKEMGLYAKSQVIEQIVRIGFMLAAAFYLVKILQMDNIYAIYMAVLATSVAAIITIIYYLKFDRQQIAIIKKLNSSSNQAIANKDLLKEMLWLGLPFIITSFLGNSKNLVNNILFINVAVNSASYSYYQAKLILGILQVNAAKLIALPQVLALGFSAGLVPFVTIAYESKNYRLLRRNISDIIDNVAYIGLFICFCLFVLAKPIYFILFGDSNLALGTEILQHSVVMGLFGIITPITTTLLLTVRLQKKAILHLLIGFIVKVITFYLLIPLMGYTGAIYSSVLCSLVILVLNLLSLSKIYHVSYRNNLRRVIFIVISLIAINGLFFLFSLIGFKISAANQFVALLEIIIYGITALLVYLAVSSLFLLPQRILHLSKANIMAFINKFKRGKKHAS